MRNSPEVTTYLVRGFQVGIKQSRGDRIRSFLMNFEMFFLALACTALFLFKYPYSVWEFISADRFICAIPFILSGIVLVLQTSVYKFDDLIKSYIREWEELKRSELDITKNVKNRF